MVSNLAIQTRERRKQRMLMRRHLFGMSQSKGTMPCVFNPVGKPWLRPLPSPKPVAGSVMDTMLGLVSLLPFMKRLTRGEQRWQR